MSDERRYCRGIPGEKQCYCEAFSSPDDSTPPLLCQECLHGPSKHDGLPGLPKKKAEAPQLMPATQSVPSKQKSDVTDLFKQMTSKTRAPSRTDISNISLTQSYKQAKDEVIEGYRPSGSKSRTVSGKTKKANSVKGIKVDCWLAMINELDENGELISDSLTMPLKTELAIMEKHGCAHLDAEESEHVFEATWTHDEVDACVRKLFPKPFEWIESCNKKGKEKGPIWVLLCKEKRKITKVPKDLPEGKDLLKYKGRKKGPVSESCVIIGSLVFCCDRL
ncbi:hypothetical protein BJ138DRAFT_199824 [Hygrophoropsis aurantiaca]|uniref:Uncharacterized protein n=1 Tax=Hygrophoropsis aurantiaca TaxID=72124 RepID=A0ACB7ZQQ8_9AGAM|nr:hypothetical protein BJ138DRAFT_199824 [Hygrophoropsis aurantiaca]